MDRLRHFGHRITTRPMRIVIPRQWLEQLLFPVTVDVWQYRKKGCRGLVVVIKVDQLRTTRLSLEKLQVLNRMIDGGCPVKRKEQQVGLMLVDGLIEIREVNAIDIGERHADARANLAVVEPKPME
ncbi:MAG: hypothetical protein ACFCUJ_05680 [Thiotrichales bacterium]